MTERERIHAIMRDLALPDDQYALSGSAVMFLHGIPREKPLGDLDVFVSTRLWFKVLLNQPRSDRNRWSIFTTDPTDPQRRLDPPYLYRDMHGVEVNLFFNWRTRGVGDIDCNLWVHNAEVVDGLRCVPLYMLFNWKVQVGRAKDTTDVRLIAEFFEAQTA